MHLQELASSKGFTAEELQRFGVREENGLRGQSVVIPFLDANGAEYRCVYRDSTAEGKGFIWDDRKEKPTIPYGLNRPVPIEENVWVVEGQSDCWAMWAAGIPCLGMPGATNTSCLKPEHVAPAKRVVVIQEPGEAGARFPFRVATRLYEQGYEGQVYSVSLSGFKDARAAWNASKTAFRDVLAAAWLQRRVIERPEPVVNEDDLGLYTYQELCDLADKPVDWLVEGLVKEGGFPLLAGRPGCGKSTLARNLAKAVAGGGEFLGRQCKQGLVVWVGMEESVDDLKEAIRLLNAETLPILYRKESFHGDQLPWLTKMVSVRRPTLVIVDTIGAFSDIENVNDYSQVVRATKPFMDLRKQFGTAFVLLHHTKENNKVLGSTYWEGAVDTIMVLTRNDIGDRFIQTVKQRGLSTIGFEDQTVITMDHVTGEIIATEPKFTADLRVAEERALEVLSDGERRTKSEIAQLCGRKTWIGRRAVDDLVSRGFLSVEGTGVKGDPKLYFIPRPALIKDGESSESVTPTLNFRAKNPSEPPDSSLPLESSDSQPGKDGIFGETADVIFDHANRIGL